MNDKKEFEKMLEKAGYKKVDIGELDEGDEFYPPLDWGCEAHIMKMNPKTELAYTRIHKYEGEIYLHLDYETPVYIKQEEKDNE